MKNLTRPFVALAAALLFPVIAHAAVDMFLKLENGKGEKRIVHLEGDACVVDGLGVGKYSVEVCDAQGKVVPTDVVLQSTVVTAREAGSGMATGRRQYQPIRITKAARASGVPATNEIAIDEPGVHLVIAANVAAADAAVAKATKTRSNIQNN